MKFKRFVYLCYFTYMNSINTIITKIKVTFMKRYRYEITENELAIILNIKPNLFIEYIINHKIPYKQICDLCYIYKIDINKLFYNQQLSHDRYKIQYFHNKTISLDTGFVYTS